MRRLHRRCRCGAFIAFALAFAVKTPLFPFHTWLPDAHVQAPTAGSIILAGVLLKMGTYGYLRLAMPIFPQAAAQFGPMVATLAVIGILYGALVAVMQKDIKSLVAYSSVAHLGYVMLGLVAFNAHRDQRLGPADGQSRPEHGRPLPHGRAALRAAPHAHAGRLWRAVEEHSGLLRPLPGGGHEQRRAARSQWLCGRVHHHAGRLRVDAGLCRDCGGRRDSGGLVSADGLPQDGPGRDHQSGERSEHLKDLRFDEVLMVLPLVILFFVIGLFPNLFFDKINPSVEALVAQQPARIEQAAQLPRLRSSN